MPVVSGALVVRVALLAGLPAWHCVGKGGVRSKPYLDR